LQALALLEFNGVDRYFGEALISLDICEFAGILKALARTLGAVQLQFGWKHLLSFGLSLTSLSLLWIFV
jgi:hypothetical protein